MAGSFPVNLYPFPTVGGTDERLTVSSVAISFSTNWNDGTTKFVVLDVQAYDVYCTFDGSAPTSSNGHKLYAGQSYTWSARTAVAAKFIRSTSDATIHASPFTY